MAAMDIIVSITHFSRAPGYSLDAQKNLLTVTAFTPRLRLDFTYTATGRILLVAVKGEGPAFFEFGLFPKH